MARIKHLFFILFVLFGVGIYVESSAGLFGFDEFIDDDPQLIQEVVEDELGNTCSNCNTTMRINFPNGTLYGFFFMTYNSTAGAYEKQLNLSLVASNTTRYTVSIISNRTTSGELFNGTSDRTIITIYDIFPPVDNQWDVGLVIIFVVIQWIFVFLAYRFHDEHTMVKYTFFAIALAVNSLLLGIGQRILSINGISSITFVNMIDSAEAIGLWITYIFTAYVFIFLVYSLVTNVLTGGRELSRRISRRER